MLLDAIFWPSNKEKEIQVEGVILHEYHHLGLVYWFEKNEKRNIIIKEKDGFGLSVKLLENIIGEGSATYIFNQNEDLTDLLEEGYDESIAKQYSESIQKNKVEIEQLIYKFQNDLEYLLENKENYDRLKDRISDYGFSIEHGQPIDKSIGVTSYRGIKNLNLILNIT